MPWFKIDDGFWSHPKTLRLSDGAVALWLRAGSWSMHHLTDGFIPDHALRILNAKPRHVAELQTVSLWLLTQEGNQFHDWEKYQPTREQVEADRRAAADRKQKSREKSRRDSRVTDTGVTEGVTPTPTRPDPTRPEVSKDTSPSEGESKLKETRLPKDWAPTAEHISKARELGVDVASEVENFRLHAEAHDRHAARWNAAFTTWLKKAKPSQAKPNPDWALRL